MDPLEQARSKQRDIALRTTISIPLALLEDLIKEITELRELMADGAAAISAMEEHGNAQAPEVHGRARLRPVGGHEGRPGADRGGVDGPNNAA